MLTCDSRSRVDPNRLFVFRAPEATPRTRPIDRDKKLTNRSASPSGYVCKIIASDSCTGIFYFYFNVSTSPQIAARRRSALARHPEERLSRRRTSLRFPQIRWPNNKPASYALNKSAPEARHSLARPVKGRVP